MSIKNLPTHNTRKVYDLKLENDTVSILAEDDTAYRQGKLVPDTLRLSYAQGFLYYFCVGLVSALISTFTVFGTCYYPHSQNPQQCLREPVVWLMMFYAPFGFIFVLFSLLLIPVNDTTCKSDGVIFKLYYPDSGMCGEYVYKGKHWEKFHEELSKLNEKE